MTGLIPENLLEDILSRVDIVGLISSYIPLKKSGRNFKATCPFHHEKTPSFMVSPDRQIYHCFGCGESGNAFKFLMRYERLEFPEAVETLAKKVGVVLPVIQKQDDVTVGVNTKLYKINELAACLYESNLNNAEGQQARTYLSKRGIKQETAKLLKLGFAVEKWDALISDLRIKNINLSLIEKAGLILAKDTGGYYDRFRNRIIFPIFDIKDRILGFGARVLDSTLPKYVNSPETLIYTKGKHLYGLNFSRDSIRENDSAIVVEGYLDFIIPFQAGVKNIVASLGTALTTEQVRLLKRYTHNIVMVYDPDTAGELATLRSLDIFIEEEMNVKVVSLPKGDDPDLFVRGKGVESFKDKINEAQDLIDYKLGILKSRYASKDIEGKAKIASSMLETINKFKNAVLKSEYIKKLAQELDVREDALLQEAKKTNKQKLVSEDVQPVKKESNINPTEKLLIKLMLEEKDLIGKIRDSLEPADFRDDRTCRIVSVMFDLLGQGKNIEPNLLMNYLGEEDVNQVVGESMFLPEVSLKDREKVVDECIHRIKFEKIKLKKQDLHDQIEVAQNTGDEEKLHRLVEEFHSLIKKR